MNEDAELNFDEANRWLRWAREDLGVAQLVVDHQSTPRAACTFAQQCAEKALKAIAIAHGIDPPKTHNLLELEQLLLGHLSDVLANLDLERLTRWSVVGRYPGDLEEATAADASHAILTASAVYGVVEAHLQQAQPSGQED